MLALIFGLFSFISVAYFIFKFITADGDFTLLSKKHAKREEMESKVVWITGASRGIGEALAKQCASLGAKLIISARNEAELQRVKKELSGKHAPDEVVVLPLDLGSDEDSLREAVQKAESCFGGAGVDIMIHNAAFDRPKSPALDVTLEGMKTTFNINVFGTITLTRLLVPSMLKRGRGQLVVAFAFIMDHKFVIDLFNLDPVAHYISCVEKHPKRGPILQMSSASGKTPAPGQAVYSATKFALNGYFHTLRSELNGKGLKVTLICPGPIETSGCASHEKRLSPERCAELITVAATHGLKEAWISYQPVLGVMYLAQYMPTICYFLIDKIGAKRLEAAADNRSTYMLSSILGKKKGA